MSQLGKVLGHALFWTWNFLFIALAGFGLVPRVLLEILRDTVDGRAPWAYTAFALLVVLLPPAAVVLGLVKLRGEPAKLVELLLAVEAPLFIVGLVRLLALPELNRAVAFLVAALFIGAGGYLWGLLREGPLPRWWALLRLAAATVGSGLVAYLAALVSFYVVPLGWTLAEGFFSFGWVHHLGLVLRDLGGTQLVFALLAAAFSFFAATLLLAVPVATPWLHVRAWRRLMVELSGGHGPRLAWGVAGSTLALAVGLFSLAASQPQRGALARLERPPADVGELEALLGDEGLRAGLVAAYLGSYRYPLTSRDRHVGDLYVHVVGLPSAAAEWVQSAFGLLAAPFIYDGESFHEDHRAAGERYQALFDVPIQKAERERIRRALGASFRRDEVPAGLLNIDEERVRLVEQELSVEEHGDLADLELHEVYENTTLDQQEVQYVFSLPASAALTGLWLGESADRDRRDAFVVAPRGAAQQVYREEVGRRVDPALLEQVGPRQYRLRAFPVPPLPPRGSPQSGRPRLHLWMTWRVLASPAGWAAPRLLEKRNVFWTWRTERRLAGAKLDESGWLPAALPRRSAEPPRRHRVELSDGTVVEAAPSVAPAPTPRGRRFAAVVDRTRSMARRAGELESALEELGRVEAGGNTVDVYFASSKGRPDGPFRRRSPTAVQGGDLLFFGAQSLQEMLRQLTHLSERDRYDAVLLLTDDDAYEGAREGEPVAHLDSPLWVVHLGGALARGYDDATLALLQRAGGGVAESVSEAVERVTSWHGGDRALLGHHDGYVWRRIERAGQSEERFAALAARQVLATQARSPGAPDLAHLDRLHGLARRYGVVSPWSSMIVLVSDAQRRRLAELEAKDDRFEREHEGGEELLVQSSGEISITGVPEPHEWVLIVLAGVMVLYAWRRRLLVGASAA